MKTRPKIIDRILETLKNSQTICIVGHVRPDGDCIGSQLGLALALRATGKRVTVWNEDPIPAKLAFLDTEGLLKPPCDGMEFDCVVAVDCAALHRMGSAADHIGRRKSLVNIDHHESNDRYGDINWISGYEPSTGELIYKLLRAANWRISPEIADCLFTALATDTGSFLYPTTKPDTYAVAGKLVNRGANLSKICNQVYQSFPLARVRLLRHVYNSFRLVHNNQLAYFWLKKRDFTRAGAERTDAEGLIDHVRDIEPVIVACVFEELEAEMTRVSLRSKSPHINVAAIASLFEGGGHAAAAGARIAGRPISVQRRMVAAIKKELKHSADNL